MRHDKLYKINHHYEKITILIDKILGRWKLYEIEQYDFDSTYNKFIYNHY